MVPRHWQKRTLEKIVGKEESAGNQLFLLFPQCFPKLFHNTPPFTTVGHRLWGTIDSFPNDKILDSFKLKAFADDKLDGVKMMISFVTRLEIWTFNNTFEEFVGEKDACYQHFL